MTKEVYRAWQDGCNKNTDAKTITEKTGLTKKDFLSLCDEHHKKYQKRNDLKLKIQNFEKHLTPLERLTAKKEVIISKLFELYVRSINNEYIRVHLNSADTKIVHDTYYDYNGYAKSYGHPMKIHTYDIHLPKLKNNCIISGEDEAGHYYYSEKISNHVQKRMYFLYKKTGYEIQTLYRLEIFGYNYHGASINDCIEGLKKKINKLKSKINKLPENITAQWYHDITGACMAGIEHWKHVHNIDSDSITREKFLSELSEKDFGYSKVMEL